MELLKLFNQPNLSSAELSSLPKRVSVRAIIKNEVGQIALLYSRKFNYHELPGGTVEPDESADEAVVRECLEETGCKVVILKELGMVQGLRQQADSFQLNEVHGYLTEKTGDMQDVMFDEDEIEEDFELQWVSIEAAVGLFTDLPESSDMYRQFIKERGLVFLQQAVLDEV